MDKNKTAQDEAGALEAAPRKISIVIRRLFALVRFLVFLGLLIFFASSMISFGPEGTVLSSIPFFWIIMGILGVVVLGGIILFLFTLREAPSAMSSSINIEIVAAVVIGMVALMVGGVLIFLQGETPSQFVMLGAILVGIYAYYIYRILKENLRVMKNNEEIRRKYGALVEVDREKSNFMLVTSHQLRTPLTEMKWSLESMLRGDDTSPAIRKTLERYRTSVDRLIKTINDMLTPLSSKEEIKIVLTKTELDLTGLLQESVEQLGSLATAKRVNLVFSEAESKSIIMADRAQLKQVFVNIIDNAVRYSPDGTVRISLRHSGKNDVIRVEDTGIGIEAQDYPRVFRRFFRAKNALLAEPDGSGLGLYNAERIIEAHGGSIDFTSVVGKGSVFTIIIPGK